MDRKRQSLTGEVVSTKMDNTVVVTVVRRTPHKVYKKIIKQTKKYLAHVTNIKPNEGDIVRITAIRPKSKLKRWQVSEIIRKSVNVGQEK